MKINLSTQSALVSLFLCASVALAQPATTYQLTDDLTAGGAEPGLAFIYLAHQRGEPISETMPAFRTILPVRQGDAIVLTRWPWGAVPTQAEFDAVTAEQADVYRTPWQVADLISGPGNSLRLRTPGEKETARQAAKPQNLRNAEKKVIQFLRSEGAIPNNATSVTQAQLEAMFAAWDALPGNQGDARASRYERLMRPVRLLGGSDLDIYFHP